MRLRRARAAAPVPARPGMACRWWRGGVPVTAAAAVAARRQTCVPPSAIDQPAAKLSQTGCMDPGRHEEDGGAASLPYDVNSPLWSDGADKQRGLALPTGGKIHVKNCATTPAECPQGAADDGKWVLPVGTVMVKSFLFDGKLVETRLFVHFDAATWVGYSYQWDEAQTDATIVADERVEIAVQHRPAHGDVAPPEPHGLHDLPHADRRLDAWSRDRADEPRRRRHEPDRSPHSAGAVRDRARDAVQGGARRSRHGRRERRRSARARTCTRTAASATAPTTRTSRASTCVATSRSRTRTPAAPAPERGNQGVPTSLVITPGQPAQSAGRPAHAWRRPTTRTASTAACRRSRATSSTRRPCR